MKTQRQAPPSSQRRCAPIDQRVSIDGSMRGLCTVSGGTVALIQSSTDSRMEDET
ncbi:MAG: hypothetical protein KDA25_07000 [Phycisphaerales bacterium]|nr:hypothetical protein [Phycisphaerales bacterium]